MFCLDWVSSLIGAVLVGEFYFVFLFKPVCVFDRISYSKETFISVLLSDIRCTLFSASFPVVLWLYVYHKGPKVNWDTSGEAKSYKSALDGMLKMVHVEDHVKNYRPFVLVLAGLPCVRPALVYFADAITSSTGLLVWGHILVVRNRITPPLSSFEFKFNSRFIDTLVYRMIDWLTGEFLIAMLS